MIYLVVFLIFGLLVISACEQIVAKNITYVAPDVIISCNDSDGGINLNEAGRVSCIYSNSGERRVASDSCSPDVVNQIYESYLEDRLMENDRTIVRKRNFNCSEGYVCITRRGGSRCVPEEEANFSCTDSDGGRNYYTRGTIVGSTNTRRTDSCRDGEDGFALIEYWCIGDIFRSEIYDCSSGCSLGRCIHGEENFNPY